MYYVLSVFTNIIVCKKVFETKDNITQIIVWIWKQ